MLEPFLVQVRVRGGFPDHLQFRVTSESTSTVTGLGSTTSIGPTEKQIKIKGKGKENMRKTIDGENCSLTNK